MTRRSENSKRTTDARRPECGTNAGFHAHRYRNEPPCEPCRVARREHERALRANRRERLDTFTHPSHTAWDSGCRCEACKKWHSDRGRAYYSDNIESRREAGRRRYARKKAGAA